MGKKMSPCRKSCDSEKWWDKINPSHEEGKSLKRRGKREKDNAGCLWEGWASRQGEKESSFDFRRKLRKKNSGPEQLKWKAVQLGAMGGAGAPCGIPAGLSPPPLLRAAFLSPAWGRNFPMASPPAGCGRCSAPSPSAKEVLENRGLFPCSISRKKEKKEFVCVSVSEFAVYSNNSKTPCNSCRSSHVHLYRNMK